MRLVGYCRTCHRVRYVTVTSSDLARSMAARDHPGVASGECSDCEDRARYGKAPDCPHHDCRNPSKCRGVRCFYQPRGVA